MTYAPSLLPPRDRSHAAVLFFVLACYLGVMGRTVPSTTQIVSNLIAELKPFYRALRRSDQIILDQFFEAILQHRDPIGNADSLLPMEIVPYVILMEERKKLDVLIDELKAANQPAVPARHTRQSSGLKNCKV